MRCKFVGPYPTIHPQGIKCSEPSQAEGKTRRVAAEKARVEPEVKGLKER